MADDAQMMVRRRLAEYAGGRVLTDDEMVAVMVAAGGLWDAVANRDKDAFMDAMVCLVECWPKRLLLGETGE